MRRSDPSTTAPVPTSDTQATTPNESTTSMLIEKLHALTDGKTKGSNSWPRERAVNPINDSADQAIQNFFRFGQLSAPVVTAVGIDFLTATGDYAIILQMLGIPLTTGGVIIDAVKLIPFLLASVEEGIRGGLTKLISLIFERKTPEDAENSRIFQSFLIRMAETAYILTLFKLETTETIKLAFQEQNIEKFVALTLLNSAYVSRNNSFEILLASKHKLDRYNCPILGRNLFDKIMNLKTLIKAALESETNSRKYSTKEEKEHDEARMVTQWIPLIHKGELITKENKPDATLEQIKLVNEIVSQIHTSAKVAFETSPKPIEEVCTRMSFK